MYKTPRSKAVKLAAPNQPAMLGTSFMQMKKLRPESITPQKSPYAAYTQQRISLNTQRPEINRNDKRKSLKLPTIEKRWEAKEKSVLLPKTPKKKICFEQSDSSISEAKTAA